MSEAIAARAAARVVRRPVDAIRPAAAGRSSAAWAVDSAAECRIVRVPTGDCARPVAYEAEAMIGHHLAAGGHAVAIWETVVVDGLACSVSRRLPGSPVDAEMRWSNAFAQALAGVLGDLHAMPTKGFGPLADDGDTAVGTSVDRTAGIVDRWRHARIWPFDRSSLADHPIAARDPDLARSLAPLRGEIEDAACDPIGLVHSDLHPQHLLVADDGSLAGLLDFGDAFVGATAWDVGLLRWYYGRHNAELVARYAPNGVDELERGALLSIAVGLYKMAKNPADSTLTPRLRRCFDDVAIRRFRRPSTPHGHRGGTT